MKRQKYDCDRCGKMELKALGEESKDIIPVWFKNRKLWLCSPCKLALETDWLLLNNLKQ